jgi:hypothetical protein
MLRQFFAPVACIINLWTIVNDDSRVVNKLEASLTDDARVVIYDRHMFIVQVTDYSIT